MLVRFYVVIEPYCVFLAGGTANCIIYFDYCVIVTDVIVTGSDVIKPILFIVVIVVHDVIMEPCGCQWVTMALMLWAVV